jgi:hypothetical protein
MCHPKQINWIQNLIFNKAPASGGSHLCRALDYFLIVFFFHVLLDKVLGSGVFLKLL